MYATTRLRTTLRTNFISRSGSPLSSRYIAFTTIKEV
jgi:hypothetical protein